MKEEFCYNFWGFTATQQGYLVPKAAAWLPKERIKALLLGRIVKQGIILREEKGIKLLIHSLCELANKINGRN